MKIYKFAGKNKGYVDLALIIGVFIIFEFLFYYFYFSVNIVINHRELKVRRGTTLGEVLRSHKEFKSLLKRGNLVSVDGKLLQKGGGLPPTIILNKRYEVSLDYEIKDGDVFEVRPGKDELEKIIKEIKKIPPSIEIIGRGPLVRVEREGVYGLKEVFRGKKSKLVFKETVVKAPSPTIVRRFFSLPDLMIALTFDDGPHPLFTLQILSILRSKNVPATFFVIGRCAEKYPDVVKEVAKYGYEIGNHSYSHANLSHATSEQIAGELDATTNIIAKLTGKNCEWFRPSGGRLSPPLVEAARARGLGIVLWSVDPKDWKRKGAPAIANTVVAQVKPGAVILLHDGGGNQAATVSALPKIIDVLRAQGYTFVTLKELYGG